MSIHYIAVLMPEATGGWSVLFPDLPGCATQGDDVREAIAMAADAAAGWLEVTRDRGDQIPVARSFEEIRSDEALRAEYEIDWSETVASLIVIGGAGDRR